MKLSLRRSLVAACLAIAALAQAVAAPAQAQTQAAVTTAAPMTVNLGAGNSQSITLPRGQSAIVDLPIDARDVLVTNPQVADAVLRSPRRIYVMGLQPGATDAAFFDAAGRRILALNIRVDENFTAVSQTLARLMPDARIHVEGANNSIVLSGRVANLTEVDQAVQVAQQFVHAPEQVVNLLQVAGKDQVMVKVRVVEMQRTVIKQLGFNLNALVGQAGGPQFLLGSAATFGVNGAILGGLNLASQIDSTLQPEVFAFDPVTGKNDLPIVCGGCNNGGQASIATLQPTAGSNGLNKGSAAIEAFERVGLIRTLAEPNLSAVSGESAKFLAGGEFPVPTGEDSTGRVTIEFKPFGVGLGFTPVVLSEGRISLKISTEVSQLTNQGAFTLSTGTGNAPLTIPGLIVRRAETTVELPSGGSMMIAGLMQEQTKQDLDSLPGLMNLPVLGALFRSRDYQEGETELVVIVTPYLVSPTSPANFQTPADGFEVARDAQTYLLGRMNDANHTPPAAIAGKTYQGPVGYVID